MGAVLSLHGEYEYECEYEYEDEKEEWNGKMMTILTRSRTLSCGLLDVSTRT